MVIHRLLENLTQRQCPTSPKESGISTLKNLNISVKKQKTSLQSCWRKERGLLSPYVFDILLRFNILKVSFLVDAFDGKSFEFTMCFARSINCKIKSQINFKDMNILLQ